MKKFAKLGTMLLAAALLFTGGVKAASDVEVVANADAYEVELSGNENLAMSKYDWTTDKVGSAETTFSENGMMMKNFNKGGSAYALYNTNRLDEFKFSMYANLNLTWPSAKGYDNYDFNYSNLYISFLIDADSPVPANTCPWNGNKAYMSLCFEERYDDATQTENDIVSLYMNECWNRRGDVRYSVAEARDVDFNDGQYHWYELEVKNFSETTIGANGKEVRKTGKKITFLFDGQEVFTYSLLDGNRVTQSADGEKMYVNFTALDGYIGFWPSSDFPVGADIDTTDCYVEISKMKVVDLDTGSAFTKVDAPEFDIEVLDWSPNASYETGEDIEVKLANLFSYEGEESLTYEVTCNGDAIGTVRNGFWVWNPIDAGTYDVNITAKAGNKAATAYVTFRTVAAKAPTGTTPTPDTDSNTDTTTSESSSQTSQSSGCGGVVGGGLFLLPVAVALVALKKKEN